MREDFELVSKPFSINAAFYGDARTKTASVREWASRIFHQLNSAENLEKMKRIREYFDENKHSLMVEACAIYPRSEFITKANILSSKTIDITNWEKLLTDLFFDKQYWEKPNPYGVKNICLNDKFIVEMRSQKKFHEQDEHLLQYSVLIVPRSF